MEYFIIPKYCNSSTILLVNQHGLLRKLHCPFRVQCRSDTGMFKSGMWLWVEEVAINQQDQLIYWILGGPYLYTSFEIKATF